MRAWTGTILPAAALAAALSAGGASAEICSDIDGMRDAVIQALKDGDTPALACPLLDLEEVDIVFADGDTPLSDAIFEGNFEVAKVLLERGADPNAGRMTPIDTLVSFNMGRPPMWPLRPGAAEMFAELAARGAVLDLRTGERLHLMIWLTMKLCEVPVLASEHDLGLIRSALRGRP